MHRFSNLSIISLLCIGLMNGFSLAVADDRNNDRNDSDNDNRDSRRLEGPSPQGIENNTAERRDRAKGNREYKNKDKNDDIQTYDGTDNNQDYPEWGSSFSQLQRMGSGNNYGDGASSMAGTNWKSAREVSNIVSAQDAGEFIPNTFSGTDFVWQWGQFIDHDLSITDGAEEAEPIEVPKGDALFDPTGTGNVTIPFARALFDHNTGTSTDNPREQENEISSWIDGSMVYGSSEERANALRLEGTPFLKTSEGNLLPFNTDSLVNANGFVSDPETLFVGGDIRANEQIGLTVMHTLFVREHNRLAEWIQEEEGSLTAEEVFQRARRLVISKIQKITYDEWLPALLGEDYEKDYMGKYKRYDDDVNPSIYNEFSVAAFRLGHSMVNETLLRVDARGNEIQGGHLSLAQSFFTAPQILTDEGSLDPILRGLASQEHQKLDVKVVNPLRNFLFGAPGAGGLDLVSLNIQRGRDHGVLSYNEMRDAMDLDKAKTFSDITRDAETQAALQEAYTSVDEIDLWVGGLAEDTDGDSQLGEIFSQMVAKQFGELRDGDRFWYENIKLSRDEEDEIDDTTLAQIIRDNTSIGDELQDNVFIKSNRR